MRSLRTSVSTFVIGENPGPQNKAGGKNQSSVLFRHSVQEWPSPAASLSLGCVFPGSGLVICPPRSCSQSWGWSSTRAWALPVSCPSCCCWPVPHYHQPRLFSWTIAWATNKAAQGQGDLCISTKVPSIPNELTLALFLPQNSWFLSNSHLPRQEPSSVPSLPFTPLHPGPWEMRRCRLRIFTPYLLPGCQAFPST